MRIACLLFSACVLASGPLTAGPLQDLLGERLSTPARVPDGVRVVRDVAYGADPAQRFDVYTSSAAAVHDAPIIVMVHGGGWRNGDKSMASVVENKVARWVPRGYVFISINYRMLPGADPLTQAGDVARAVAFIQSHAASWGGSSIGVILMGHSAGAHLVSLLTASPGLAAAHGVQPWLGTVALDGAAFDVPRIMGVRHFGLYDEAFGRDPAYWRSVSPADQLNGATAPLLAVCSNRRAMSCAQAETFMRQAVGFGNRTLVLHEDLSHRDINVRLGLPGAYTDGVEQFLASLTAK